MQKNIIRIIIIVGLILLIPLVLTLINPNARINGGSGGGWDWAPGSFFVMGTLLFCTGLAIDFAARKFTNSLYRVTAIIAIVILFLLIWVELAVDGVSTAIKSIDSRASSGVSLIN